MPGWDEWPEEVELLVTGPDDDQHYVHIGNLPCQGREETSDYQCDGESSAEIFAFESNEGVSDGEPLEADSDTVACIATEIAPNIEYALMHTKGDWYHNEEDN